VESGHKSASPQFVAAVTRALGIDTARHLTVVYSDGRTVPCRTAAPRETVTFPGHGFGTGTGVTGLRDCPAEPA
ncbi:hypothetical protein ACSNOF_10875, partial [Streptomyces sp. URMC 125]